MLGTSLSRQREQMHKRVTIYTIAHMCEIMYMTAALIIQCH